jgi:hypothetical protein
LCFRGKIGFSAKIKLLEKMPKMPKVEVRLRRIDFIKLERRGKLLYNFADLWLPILQTATAIKKTEHSDTTILGTLGILGHFRHF